MCQNLRHPFLYFYICKSPDSPIKLSLLYLTEVYSLHSTTTLLLVDEETWGPIGRGKKIPQTSQEEEARKKIAKVGAASSFSSSRLA